MLQLPDAFVSGRVAAEMTTKELCYEWRVLKSSRAKNQGGSRDA